MNKKNNREMKPKIKSDEQQRDENVAFIWGLIVGILFTMVTGFFFIL